MNVLCHGIPFCCDNTPLDRYAGPHDVRSVGNYPKARYRYDPLCENAAQVIERIRRDWNPELLLCWVPEIHPPPLGVEDAPLQTVALVSDWNIYYPLLHVNLARYDLALCDKPGVRALRSDMVHPRHLFPLYSYISGVHKPHPVERTIDVLFLGNLNHAVHRDRARYLERLAKLSDRYRILIASGFEGDAYAELISKARIVFNHSIRGELNLRVFETIACGSAAFIEESNQEVRDWFQDGIDAVLYNADNFEDRIHHHLAHPEDAEAVAARGHARAGEFAGENRFTQLIDWCAAQTGGNRPFRELPPDERDYQTLVMYGCSRWPVYHAIEKEYLDRTAKSRPDDPRVWTAIGKHFLNALGEAHDDRVCQQQFAKAFAQAARLDPESGPYALNAASIYRMVGAEERETQALGAVLSALSLAGAELVVGNHTDPFWARWHRAVAEDAAGLHMLKAEAHIRLAAILARRGATDLAEDHLAQAETLDPENTSGVRLSAELAWARGDRDRAVALLARRLPDMPFDLESRNRLAEMLEQQGETKRAQKLRQETQKLTTAVC